MIQALSESQESSEKRTISKISRYASQEIRLILDNGVEKDQNTFVMLATFRQQVVEPLIDQGVSVDWKLLCLMDQDIIPTSSSLNLFRIFQEAFHNAHVRAQCKHIEVKAEIHEASVVKIIIVNSGGVTFDPTGKSGNGIINMKRRALMIDASFDIHPIPSGAKVEIIFNLHSPVVLQSVIKST
jgi:signal transduction histidine kinase